MTWIQTYTGKKFDILDPTADMVCLEDIAWALANIQRYGGHAQRTYSVAEHSINVMMCVGLGGNPALARAALFHDAAEAYIGDIVTPLKRLLDVSSCGALRLIEQGIERTVAERFGLRPASDYPAIKQADSYGVLAAEVEVLLDPVPANEWARWEEQERKPWPDFIYRGWDRAEAAEEFMHAARCLGVR